MSLTPKSIFSLLSKCDAVTRKTWISWSVDIFSTHAEPILQSILQVFDCVCKRIVDSCYLAPVGIVFLHFNAVEKREIFSLIVGCCISYLGVTILRVGSDIDTVLYERKLGAAVPL